MSGERPPVDRPTLIARYQQPILFFVLALALGGIYSYLTMPASVFPVTDFPRVVLLIDDGVMPADEMMATITRPVEEAMKNIPGTRTIRSATSRGSSEVNVFFEWKTDMEMAEQYVLGRLAQIRPSLSPSATFAVHRMTFSAFPILGVGLSGNESDLTDLWEIARYELSPRMLRIPGVARVNIVGGRRPEYQVCIDPDLLEARRLSFEDVALAVQDSNLFVTAGMHEENRQLFLTVTDHRLQSAEEIADVIVAWDDPGPIRVRDVATVVRGVEPRFQIVSAEGKSAVLLNVYSQPDGNTTAIADSMRRELDLAGGDLPTGARLSLFYDQSEFVNDGLRSVWESIVLGLILSALVLYGFLRTLSVTLVAASVIPLTVLATLLWMRLSGLTFNLMTLGGVAAAIGLIIDDAIVVVEAIHFRIGQSDPPDQAIRRALREVGLPLIGSTATPIVVFIPLAFLDGVPGVFFRALAVTMVFALLTSLMLAVTWSPAAAGLFLRRGTRASGGQAASGPLVRPLTALYETAIGWALRNRLQMLALILVVLVAGTFGYRRIETGFLPEQDEGAFVLDYYSRPGTSLGETDRMLRHVEQILTDTEEIESYSRRTGARLALAIAEPNTGDFLVRLRRDRERTTTEVIDELRERVHAAEPALETEFPGVLADLIGDLTWSSDPVEIKLIGNDEPLLARLAEQVAATIEQIPGVVDVNPGVVVAGPSQVIRLLDTNAARAGIRPRGAAEALATALHGEVRSQVMEGDRTVGVRVLAKNGFTMSEQELRSLPIRDRDGGVQTLDEVADIRHVAGILEKQREDLRQLVTVSARLSGIGLQHGLQLIRQSLAKEVQFPSTVRVEYGGLYKEQQESFKNLTLVLLLGVVLVFMVLLLEFRAFSYSLAIVLGTFLSLSGVVLALLLTGTTMNIVSCLGAIIGFGIVAKNGILLLDQVQTLRAAGETRFDSLVLSGRRRLRPVLMTTLTTVLGLLPLAYGVGAGADMLRPLAIAVIGAVFLALPLSLVATPWFQFVLEGRHARATTAPDAGIRSTK